MDEVEKERRENYSIGEREDRWRRKSFALFLFERQSRFLHLFNDCN